MSSCSSSWSRIHAGTWQPSGALTAGAVITKYQQRLGYPVTGDFEPKTLAAVKQAAGPSWGPSPAPASPLTAAVITLAQGMIAGDPAAAAAAADWGRAALTGDPSARQRADLLLRALHGPTGRPVQDDG